MAVDLYREKNEDAHISDMEWREVKQACEYILSPFGMWNHDNDSLNESAVHNTYMNMR